MQLSLTQACSWALLLVVSSFLLWQNVASTSMDQMSTTDLYNLLVRKSSDNRNRVSLLYREYGQTYANRSWYREDHPCHTGALLTSEIKQRLQYTKDDDVLQEMIFVTNCWKILLKQAVLAVAHLPGRTVTLLMRASAAQDTNEVILEALRTISKKLQLEEEKTVNASWMELSELKSPNEITRRLTLFNVLRCLYRDTRNFNTYIQVLTQRSRCLHSQLYVSY
ncbi:prolactin-3D4-like [Nannospalax galili]|uniref:prolactin-3D4-like n=1 Tax=Nannospalax galili TaxID=1026970 RepID=UPI00081A10CB|nr:prolactin-3D4-like [Nannospalax galili]